MSGVVTVSAISAPHLIAGIAAAAWAAVLVARRAQVKRGHLAVASLGITLLAVFASGVIEFPDIEKLLEDLSRTLGKWTYLVVGLLTFLETGAFIGLLAPGEAAVIVGGVVAGNHEIEINLLIGIVWLAAMLGDMTSFFIGKRLGRGFMLRHGPRFRITEAHLVKVEKYLENHGGKTIVIGRFIGFVRPLAPFIAGASRMPFRRFAPYEVLGSGLFATTFCALGYAFAQSIDQVLDYAKRGSLIFGWTIGTIAVTIYLARRFRDPAQRAALARWFDEQERHPRRRRLLRPPRLAWTRIVAPAARFAWPRVKFAIDRFTPGDLGIEFTTAAAVAAVSTFGFFFYLAAAKSGINAVAILDINTSAFRVADSMRNAPLTEFVKIVSDAGRAQVVIGAVAVTTVYCLWRRRFAEACVVALSLALTMLASQTTKSYVDESRPLGSLVTTDGSSFPSGHAAQAVSFVVIALALERIGGVFGRIALVTIALTLSGAIALSRVYLRAHYLSDVIAGTALGAAVASLVACVALVTVHVRGRRGQGRDREPDA